MNINVFLSFFNYYTLKLNKLKRFLSRAYYMILLPDVSYTLQHSWSQEHSTNDYCWFLLLVTYKFLKFYWNNSEIPVF